MTDDALHEQITRLVDEEHALRGSENHSAEDRERLRRLEVALDQCWDLLRQREALRESGGNPAAAEVRPETEVEGYLQ